MQTCWALHMPTAVSLLLIQSNCSGGVLKNAAVEARENVTGSVKLCPTTPLASASSGAAAMAEVADDSAPSMMDSGKSNVRKSVNNKVDGGSFRQAVCQASKQVQPVTLLTYTRSWCNAEHNAHNVGLAQVIWERNMHQSSTTVPGLRQLAHQQAKPLTPNFSTCA